jgi:uncharacterized protein
MNQSLKNITGRPISSESDFYGREKEIARIWRKLENDHVLLLAPRRVGKTSLMYRLRNEAKSKGSPFTVYLSVAAVKNELDFVKAIYKALLESPEAHSLSSRFIHRLKSSGLARFLQRIESVGVSEFFEVGLREVPTEEWEIVGHELIAALRALEGQWIIMMDELPIFILDLLRQDPTAKRARAFLNWFRQVRQGTPEGESLRWLLAGSIGLDVVARRHNFSDTINDLLPETLDAFSLEISDQFLIALGESYDLPLAPEVRIRIIERAGWTIPYYLQIFFNSILESCSDERTLPSVQMVDEVFESLVSPNKRTFFDYWNQRLTEELGIPQDDWARIILKSCAADALGATRSTINQSLAQHISKTEDREDTLNWLLDILISDGYLVHAGASSEGRYRFRSNLLREFWLRRFAK